MFFLQEQEKTLTLHPSHFGPNIQEKLVQELIQEVEGSILNGCYIVTVFEPVEVSEGQVIPGLGKATYTLHYQAVVWKPFKGEVLDGIVGNVLETGFFVEIGPLNCFVAKHQINPEFKYDGNSTPPQWVNDSENEVVEKGGQVRIRLIGIRTEVKTMFAIGAMNDDYLGPLSAE